jgi:shikimate kinase
MATKRVLLTGISGVGKSTVTAALAAHGIRAVDADSAEFSEWRDLTPELAAAAGSPVEADRDWVWQEDRIHALLASNPDHALIVSGCAANMGQFVPQFHHVVLLSAPADVIAKRLRTRTNNPYGKHPAELARVLDLKESVEPLLRRIATHQIDTSALLDDVVTAILRIIAPPK